MPRVENQVSLSNRLQILSPRQPAAANLPVFQAAEMYALAAIYLFFGQKPQFG
jgi:hypothetical protein